MADIVTYVLCGLILVICVGLLAVLSTDGNVTIIGDTITRLREKNRAWLARKRGESEAKLVRKLEQLRTDLAEEIETLAELEHVMKCLPEQTTPAELIRYMDDTGIQHRKHIEERLFADDGDGELADWIDRFLQRDVVGQKWYFDSEELPDYCPLHMHLKNQWLIWTEMQDEKRRLCMDLQVEIETLSEQLGIKKDPDELTSPDKRKALKQVRVRVAELRLDEERIEQEILKEQGGDGPHRRPGGVPTNEN